MKSFRCRSALQRQPVPVESYGWVLEALREHFETIGTAAGGPDEAKTDAIVAASRRLARRHRIQFAVLACVLTLAAAAAGLEAGTLL
ncbi:hypothetical protein [Winogradskya consettensis]|uniref:hypothetical protein n=1 Tax=Winogradskya consettensis TaxID=113560 RepID=UPI001BB43207|nr:hypothetical protein [Actinoplanes consettensis]